MTRVQFLNDLYHHLYGMTQEQAEQHLTYYAEMLADRMEEGMSEEDAVASMEDVETIARRIMEGEGLPYTPPDQRPVMPPSYPDVSRLGGGGGTRAYQAPKRTKWKKIVQAALWAVAIIAVVGAVNRWRWDRSHTDTPRDIAREAPYADASAESWAYGEAPFMEGFEFSDGGTYIDTADVDCIDVEWAAGMVSVESWNEDSICVTEFSDNELNERTRMKYFLDDNVLKIRYRQSGNLGYVKDQKWLSIMIPDGMMGEIDISTASAEVQINNMELDTLRIGTASGNVTAGQCFTQTSEIKTVSGEVACSEVHAGQAEISTTSGDVYGDIYSKEVKISSTSGDIQMNNLEETEALALNTISGGIWASAYNLAAQKINIGTVSGYVSLSLPSDLGFTLNYATVSGEINVSSFNGGIRNKSGTYTYNGGGCEIEVNTTSGDVEIY